MHEKNFLKTIKDFQVEKIDKSEMCIGARINPLDPANDIQCPKNKDCALYITYREWKASKEDMAYVYMDKKPKIVRSDECMILKYKNYKEI